LLSFEAFITKQKGTAAGSFFAYPILKAQDQGFGCSQGDDPLIYAGSTYESLVKTYGGKAYALCSPTFGNDLVNLANNIVGHTVSGRAHLSQTPHPLTLKVSLDGTDMPSGSWSYDEASNSVVFPNLTAVTDANSTIGISYDLKGN